MQVAFGGVRVLLAGCGSIGLRHADVLEELGLTHLAACDPSPAAREAFSAAHPAIRMYGDYAGALRDYRPDAVFLLTPTRTHMAMAMEALAAGCHLFIEKPLSNTSEGAGGLQALADSAGRKVMVGFCFRYHQALRQAKALLEEGAIGRLISIRALMGEPFWEIHPNYREMYYAKYSGAFELVHDLDLALWFAGQQVAGVQGVYGTFSDMEMESPDTVELLVRFVDRCVANVHLDFFQSPRRRQMDLIGTKGVITVEFADWDEAELAIYTGEARAWERTRIPTRRNDMFLAEDREFLSAITQGTPIACTIAEALKSLRAVEAIYRPE